MYNLQFLSFRKPKLKNSTSTLVFLKLGVVHLYVGNQLSVYSENFWWSSDKFYNCKVTHYLL